MQTKPHILFISSWFPTKKTSAGTFVEMQILALQSRGCKCAILLSAEVTLGNFAARSFNKSAFLKYRKRPDITYVDNLTIHKLPLRMYSFPERKRKENLLQNTRKSIEKYISHQGRPDFIFHHGVFDYCYLTKHISKVFRLPVWFMEHSSSFSEKVFPCANSFDSLESQKEFVQNADRRFAVTKAYVDRMAQLFKVPFEHCPNVITDDFFKDSRKVEKASHYFQFINIAVLAKNKNQKLILEAFAKKFKNQPKFKLVVAGDGKLLEPLRQQAVDLGISDHCEIIGFQSRERVIQLLDQSHCFVLSSQSETFGVVIIEAMARGLTAISSRIDGPAEIINESNGFLFEPNSADDLAEKMSEMVEKYDSFNSEIIIDSVKKLFGPDAVKNVLFPNA